MKSATELLLNKTNEEIWFRGDDYAEQGKVNILRTDEKEIEATVIGKEEYRVLLKFVANGIKRECSCPYQKGVCKHIVATAIIWDKLRGFKNPSEDLVKRFTIAPPVISRREINALFKDPVHCDLAKLRIAVEYSAWSPKKHALLPNCPKIILDEKEPLKLKEIQKTFREMERWSTRVLYDPYLCAGEMAAAFCELLAVTEKRILASQSDEIIIIMAHCVDWYYRGFNQIVDGSDGVWLFPQTRIGKIVAWLKENYPASPAWEEFRRIVKEVGDWWGEPDLDEVVVADWKGNRI